MSYKKQLKTDYRRKTRRMSELIGDGNRSLTSREREEFASLKRDCDSISNKLDTLNVPDYRGLTGGSNSGRKAWKDDKRTEGRAYEPLSANQSMTGWYRKAQANNIQVPAGPGY